MKGDIRSRWKHRLPYSSWLRGTDCPGGSTHHLELTKGIKDDDGWLLALKLSSVYLCRTRCFLGSTRLIPDPKSKRIIKHSHRMWEVKKTKDMQRPDTSCDLPRSHREQVAEMGSWLSWLQSMSFHDAQCS